MYPLTTEQLAEWRKAAEPLQKAWADNVKKASGDADAIMKELRDALDQIPGGLLSDALAPGGGGLPVAFRTPGLLLRHGRAEWQNRRPEWRRACQAQPHGRLHRWIELTADIFIGMVAANVFVTVVLRCFGIGIPDGYDFGQLLLGILIFWGIAASSYRDTHMKVDSYGPTSARAISA